MESELLSLFDVTVEFDQSHLFFPRIVSWLLLILLGVILIKERKAIVPGLKQAGRALFFGNSDFDRFRFFGTLFLTIAYFYLMSVVGNVFPNTGYGFLLMSIPFIFLLSLLYVDNRSRRNIFIITVNAIVAPALAWYVLSQIFNITLP